MVPNYQYMAPNIAKSSLEIIRNLDASRWASNLISDSDLNSLLLFDETIEKVIKHHRSMTDIFGKMYADGTSIAFLFIHKPLNYN